MQTPPATDLTMGHSTFTPNEDAGRADSGKAFFIGLILGAAVALLCAPMTGAETRAQVAAWIARLRARIVGAMTGEDDRPEMQGPETF